MKRTIKTYEEGGIRYQFVHQQLSEIISEKKRHLQKNGEKATRTAIMEELADKLFVSVEAIKNWMYGHNGPSEIEKVKELADYFQVDYHQFLEKEDGQMTENISTKSNSIISNMTNTAQAQYTKDRAREIYRAMLGFISRCDYYLWELECPCEEVLRSEEYQESTLSAHRELSARLKGIDDMLQYSMLDFPAQFYKNVHDYIWRELNGYMDYVADPNIKENAEKGLDYSPWTWEEEMHYDQYVEEGLYLDDLRELFDDYIVK